LIRKFDEHGYDLDEKWSDDTCGRPLQYCCSWAGNFPDLKEAALLLLALGANPSLPSRPHRTNIQAALDKEVWDLYDALFRHPMTDFRDRDAVGRPVLHSVVRAAPVGRVIELIDVLAESDLSLQDHNGYTPLHVAISSGRLEVVRELLRAPGVHLDLTDNDGRTPLTLATYWGLKQIALVLIEPSHLVKMDEADHMRALILAAKHYDKELCIRLLELCRYRNLNSYVDETGKMIMHHAAREDWADVLDACIRNGGHGLRIDCIDHSGRTALHHAAFMGNIDSCRVLLQGGASLTQQDRNGKTAAQAAADAGFKETLLLLLRSGRVDPNQRDLEGRNLVHWAATLDCLDVMELIASTQGVRLDQPDKYGKLPIDIAFVCKSRSVGKYLGARMPFLDIYSWDGMYCSPVVGCVEPESIDWEKRFNEDRREGERARRKKNREAWEALHRAYPYEEWALVLHPEASTKPDIETAPRAGTAGRCPLGESPSRRGEDGGGFMIIPAESFTL
jgi:ankyrin repeat protein